MPLEIRCFISELSEFFFVVVVVLRSLIWGRISLSISVRPRVQSMASKVLSVDIVPRWEVLLCATEGPWSAKLTHTYH